MLDFTAGMDTLELDNSLELTPIFIFKNGRLLREASFVPSELKSQIQQIKIEEQDGMPYRLVLEANQQANLIEFNFGKAPQSHLEIEVQHQASLSTCS